MKDIKDYPKILQRSSNRSVRFGNIPINPDLYATSPVGKKYLQVINEAFDPIPYDVYSFTRLFWQASQLKLQFIGYKRSPYNQFGDIADEKDGNFKIKVEPIQEKDLEERKIPIQRIALGIAGEGLGKTASKNTIQYSQRYSRSFRIQKKGYLNQNFKTSIVLGKRVLLPEFEVDEKDKNEEKVTAKSLKFTNYINQIEFDKIQTDLGNAEFTHPNHLMAGGPLITNMLSLASSKTNNSFLSLNLNRSKEIKEKTKENYKSKVEKTLKDEEAEFKNRKGIDKKIKDKQGKNRKEFLDNLEKNIQSYGRGIFIDCSAYLFRPNIVYNKEKNKIMADREDYKAKEKGILAEYIKKRFVNTVYYPFVFIYVAGILDERLNPIGQGATNYGKGTKIGEVLIPWKEELSLLEQSQSKKDENNSSPGFEEDIEYGFSMYPVDLKEEFFVPPTLQFELFRPPANLLEAITAKPNNIEMKFPQTLKISPVIDEEKKEAIIPGGAAELFFSEKDVPKTQNKNKII
jgi:hypothetical protein